MKNVIIVGFGSMGKMIAKNIYESEDFKLIDIVDPEKIEQTIYGLKVKESIHDTDYDKANLVIDASLPKCVFENCLQSIGLGLEVLVVATGLSKEQVDELGKSKRIFISSNYSIGMNMLFKSVRQLAPLYAYVEIMETHADTKAEVPSGTAITTSRILVEANPELANRVYKGVELYPGSLGANVNGIRVCARRVPPGYPTVQTVKFYSTSGETFELHHEVLGRESYWDGIKIAAEHLLENGGFYRSLEEIL